jgi:hypothetical protein
MGVSSCWCRRVAEALDGWGGVLENGERWLKASTTRLTPVARGFLWRETARKPPLFALDPAPRTSLSPHSSSTVSLPAAAKSPGDPRGKACQAIRLTG